MPLFNYKCECGNHFQKKLKMIEAMDKYKCECGKEASRDYSQIQFDDTYNLRNPSSKNFWKNSLTAEEQANVISGENDPY